MSTIKKTSYWITRATNGLRKLASGLTPFSESVWPGVRNDLFVAHESIYAFFETFCRDRQVIDAGCGTGYGAHRLALAGAKEVIGIDLDERNIHFASKHYRAANLRFISGDIQALSPRVARADLIVASNSLEHLPDPAEFLRRALGIVGDGIVLIAVPPIFTSADASVHDHIHYHRSNLSVRQWLSLLEREGCCVECFAHRSRSRDLKIDFASPFPSRLQMSEFVVQKSSPEDLYDHGAITAIFAVRARSNQALQ